MALEICLGNLNFTGYKGILNNFVLPTLCECNDMDVMIIECFIIIDISGIKHLHFGIYIYNSLF